jgi:hypothetical protein
MVIRDRVEAAASPGYGRYAESGSKFRASGLPLWAFAGYCCSGRDSNFRTGASNHALRTEANLNSVSVSPPATTNSQANYLAFIKPAANRIRLRACESAP